MADNHVDLMAMAGLRDELEALRKMAQEGDPVAQFNMGVRYANGQGVPQDLLEAARWYGAAADQGDAPAQFNLGLLFYQGQGFFPRHAHAPVFLVYRGAGVFQASPCRLGIYVTTYLFDYS